jgi:hypothetical protein
MRSSVKRSPCKASASLLFNNLAANGKNLAFVHNREVIIAQDSAVTSGSTGSTLRVVEKENGVVQQVRWVMQPDCNVELLVIASTRSLQFHSPDGKRLLHTVPTPQGPPGQPHFFRGIGGCGSHVFAGCSTGELCRVQLQGPTSFGGSAMLKENRGGPITDVAAASNGATNLVASADGTGQLVVLAVGPDGSCAREMEFEFDAASLCTAVRMRRGVLLTAHASGQVRLYDLANKCIMAQIAAHARWINALEVHPARDMFATASEDATISVWRLPEGGARRCPNRACRAHPTEPERSSPNRASARGRRRLGRAHEARRADPCGRLHADRHRLLRRPPREPEPQPSPRRPSELSFPSPCPFPPFRSPDARSAAAPRCGPCTPTHRPRTPGPTLTRFCSAAQQARARSTSPPPRTTSTASWRGRSSERPRAATAISTERAAVAGAGPRLRAGIGDYRRLRDDDDENITVGRAPGRPGGRGRAHGRSSVGVSTF